MAPRLSQTSGYSQWIWSLAAGSADHSFEYHSQHGGLDSGRRGGQLVEKQEADTALGQPCRPGRRSHAYTTVHDNGQPGKVGWLPDGADHDLQRPSEILGQGTDNRRLAGAGASPEDHGNPGRDGHGQGFSDDRRLDNRPPGEWISRLYSRGSRMNEE